MKKLLILLAPLLFAACASTNSLNGNEVIRPVCVADKNLTSNEMIEYLNNLLENGDFSFRPNSFLLIPAGKSEQILGRDYWVEYHNEVIEVRLPYYTGVTPPYQLEEMNYTLVSIDNYSQVNEGKYTTISFSTNLLGSDKYNFILRVNKMTANADLEVRPSHGVSTAYNGNIFTLY